MNLKAYHLMEHASRGFGEEPGECPLCADLKTRVERLESAKMSNDSVWVKIALGATTSILAAFIIERFVRQKA